MIARLEVVKGMPLVPNACCLCGSNPVDESTGEQLDCIFAPGVDLDWGSSAYICGGCAEIIADLRGRVTVEGFDKLTKKYQELKTEHSEIVRENKRLKKLIKRVQKGSQAVKEAQKVAA